MKKLESTHFGEIFSPESIGELIDLIASKHGPASAHYWRGQADEKWRIDSTAFRRLSPFRSSPHYSAEEQLRDYERSLIDAAKLAGHDIINGRKSSEVQVLANLRHHGAATRFLDVSKSVLPALWFAASTCPDSDGILIGFDTSYLGGSETASPPEKYSDLMDIIEDIDFPHIVNVLAQTPRIDAQRSLFLVSKVSDASVGSISLGALSHEILFPIGISKAFKKHALIHLRGIFDQHRLSLFPDLSGFASCHATKFKQFENERW